MLATFLAGISLAAARWVDGGRSLNQEFWLGWGIAVAVAAGLSTIALLPSGACLLGLRQFAIGASVIGLYSVIVVVVVWVVFPFVVWGARPSAWELTGLSIVILSFTAMLILAALTAHTYGYVLIYGRGEMVDHATWID